VLLTLSQCAVLGAALALAAGCTRSAPVATDGPIVLIVVDTLRADHLSCYGYPRPTSPAMCALAEDGVRFERAYTTRTVTTPAIASMLTGLYPHRHGVTQLYFVLPAAPVTLAERLHALGWATGGFVSSFVMMRDFSGFDQGFDVYDDDVRTPELDENYERDGGTTVARAVAWLRANGPHAFLFVHLMEPHGPYRPPSPYLERFALPATGPAPGDMPDYQRLPALRTVNEYVGRYDGEIAAGDAALARLFAALRALGWYTPATIVLVADHGESLGEEGQWFRHGESVDDAEAHVPLIVKFPSGMRGAPKPGSHVSLPVSVIDIFPTVLRAAGAETGDTPAAVDLASTERVATRAAPPITELEGADNVTLSIHGEGCTVRSTLPAAAVGDGAVFAGADPAAWLALARQLRVDPSNGDMKCAQETAGQASALLADRFRFRLDVPIVVRQEMRENATRARFMADRARTVVPLAAPELEALRQLGYAE
jgi:arylsulfatase A-like enzyme